MIIALFAACLFGSALLASTSSALRLADPEALGQSRAERLALHLLRKREANLAAANLGLWVFMVLGGSLWTVITIEWLEGASGTGLVALSLAAALSLLGIESLLGYQLPQQWAGQRPEAALKTTAPLSSGIVALLRPAAQVSNWIVSRLIVLLPGGAATQPSPYTQLRHMLAGSSFRLGIQETSMMAQILDLPNRNAGQIMTPEPAIATVSHHASVKEAAKICVSSGHTRLVVVSDKDANDVKGLIHAASLLGKLLEGEGENSIETITKPALIVPSSKKLDQLLSYLQHRHQYLAVVVGEYGRVVGIVSIEDIMEEVVGEIEDEADFSVDSLQRLPDGTITASGYITLDELKTQGVCLPKRNGVSSLGGYVFSALGRLAEVGDEVALEERRLVVEEMDGARVAKVKIIAQPERSQESAVHHTQAPQAELRPPQ